MLKRIGEWWEDYLSIPGVPAWAEILILAFIMAVISVGITAVALLFIPVDYFAGPHAPDASHARHPVWRWIVRIGRNVIGWFLIVLGIVLSLPGIPGQGLLTILLGVMFADFPGKRRLELWLMRKPGVQHAVNRLRGRFGRPPLEVFPHA